MTVAGSLTAGRRRLSGDSANLDADLLLAHVLGQNRSWLLAHPEAVVTDLVHQRFLDQIERRTSGVPVAYLVGYQEFYGRRFQVNRATLIPRPESEHLVERAMAALTAGDILVDIGTGSGCLGLSVAAERPDVDVHLVDVSAVALATAADNARWLGLGVRLHRGDLWPELGLDPSKTVVIANLPYVPEGVLNDDRKLRFEPALALDGGEDGLAVIRRLLAALDRRGFQPKTLLLEHAPDQAEPVRQMAWGPVATHADLAGRARLTEIKPAPSPFGSSASVRPA